MFLLLTHGIHSSLCPYLAPTPALSLLVTTGMFSMPESVSAWLYAFTCAVFQIPHI